MTVTSKGTLNIAEMAEKYGTTARTLRFYESKGLMQPLRINTGRFYRPQDEERFIEIRTLAEIGMPLDTIWAVLTIRHRDPAKAENLIGAQVQQAVAEQRRLGVAIPRAARMIERLQVSA